jgi:flagellar hook-associated protein 2
MNVTVDDSGTAADKTDDTLVFNALNGSTFSISEAPNNFISSLGFSSGRQNFITGTDISEAVRTDLSTLNGQQFVMTLNGTKQTVKIADTALSAVSTMDDLKTAVQDGINSAFGIDSSTVEVVNEGTKLTIKAVSGAPVTLGNADTNNALGELGFSNGVSASGTSSNSIDLSGDEEGRTFTINVAGTDLLVKLDKDYSATDPAKDYDDLAAYINTSIQDQLTAKGLSYSVNVTASGSELVFSSSEKLILKKGPEDSLTSLGFAAEDNKSNSVSLTSSLFSIKDSFNSSLNVTDATKTEAVKFTINGVLIDVKKSYENATLNDVMNAVNTSSAGVELKYDSLNKRFTLTSKTEGAAGKTDFIDNAQGLLGSMGLADNDPSTAPNITVIEGMDALFDLDGVLNMKRSSNQFTIDDITYTLKPGATDTSASITVKANTEDLYKKIEGFINKYNEVVGTIYSKTVEKRPRTGGSSGDYYLPLTSEEKDAMKDSDITLWEENAKKGLLRTDPILQNIAYSMRTALYKEVPGANISLYDIGITTSKNYLDGGKLVIDEAKLKKAIESSPDQVAQLFSNESDYKYSDTAHRNERFAEEGIAQRLYDIIQDNIRVTGSGTGHKGILLEKAGLQGDFTEFNNLIYSEITDKSDLIYKLNEEMLDKENSYYAKFTAMETAISQMNAQSSWLSAQLGQGQ